MRGTMRLAIAGLLVAGLLAAAPVAFAGGKAAGVVKTGACSATSTWKLTLKNDAGRVESDVEVQTRTAGQLWKFTMTDNGVQFAKGKRTTVADGSWTATKFATNQAGSDTVVVAAANSVTGETCTATATL